MVLNSESRRNSNPSKPLLQQANGPHPSANPTQYGTGDSDYGNERGIPTGLIEDRSTISQEILLLLKSCAPLTITYVLQYSFSLITVFVVGHISTEGLAAVSLALMTSNITGLALYEGQATSLDTLCAQAYGAGRPKLVGLYLQRMACHMLLATLFVGAIWMYSGPILALLVPEQDLAHMAGELLRYMLIGAPGHALFEAGKRFVQAQGLFYAPLWVTLFCVPIDILLNWLFVFKFGWGVTGAALALSVTRDICPIALLFYVRFIKPSSLQCWDGFHKSAFNDWGPMLRLSVPGIVMIEAEWLGFEALTLAASYLGATHLAAQSIVMSICVIMAHIPLSMSVAVSTRIGNLIGSGSLPAAKTAARASVIIAVALGSTDVILLSVLRVPLVRVFSEDGAVLKIAAGAMPVLALFQFFDSTTAIINGLLRGLGKQSVGARANLLSYYLIGLPLALFLCFGKPRLELPGLWIGISIGSAIITAVNGLYCLYYDWRKAVQLAQER